MTTIVHHCLIKDPKAFFLNCSHHQDLLTWIRLTLSYNLSLSAITFVQSYRRHPVSPQTVQPLLGRIPKRNVTNKFLLSSPVLSTESCSFYSDWLTNKSNWQYSCCFLYCCFKNLLKITCIILVLLLFLRLVQVVQPYSRTDSATG